MAKVYVSSTVDDLKEERKTVKDWLVKANYQPVDSYRPASKPVLESCLRDIEKCDLYVLLIGHRYGFRPPEEINSENLSITHLEFRHAGINNIARIALLRKYTPDPAVSDIDNEMLYEQVKAFRKEVEAEVRVGFFSDLKGLVEELSTGVKDVLENLQKSHEDWISSHLRRVSMEFPTLLANLALKACASTKDVYLELVVTERHFDNTKKTDIETGLTEQTTCALEEVISEEKAPLLLIGEGGSGKTTSLLYTAVQMADRARTDPTTMIPIYVNLARLKVFSDLPHLHRTIADSATDVEDWNELQQSIFNKCRRFLFLFDGFNEMPESLQRDGVEILNHFVDNLSERHRCLIASRQVSSIELLARRGLRFKTFEILRLTPSQIQMLMETLGLGALYNRMSQPLRELAGNPFMLLAITRTLADLPENELPRNQGELYRSFVTRWMVQAERPGQEYDYKRVKEPLLIYLAVRMTAAGQTSLTLNSGIEDEIEERLREIYRHIRRRGGMPENWIVDGCLAEIFGDGLLECLSGQLRFMHQSIQEYFTALYFLEGNGDALVDFTPGLLLESTNEYPDNSSLGPYGEIDLVGVPRHRLVSALLMMVGLMKDGTRIVAALTRRNPILAAAAISSAKFIDPSFLRKMEQKWLDDLELKDPRNHVIACSCLALASVSSRRTVRRLVKLRIDIVSTKARRVLQVLKRMGARESIAIELARQVQTLSGDGFDARKDAIGKAVIGLQCEKLVRTLFDHWRASPPGSNDRRRFESMLATIEKSLVENVLSCVDRNASNPAIAEDAQRALNEYIRWNPLDRLLEVTQAASRRECQNGVASYKNQVDEEMAKMRELKARKLATYLHSKDDHIRSAAARVAAQRRVQEVGDTLLDSLLRIDQGRSLDDLVAALISLWGKDTAASRLAEGLQEGLGHIGSLDPELTGLLKSGEMQSPLRISLLLMGVLPIDPILEEEYVENGTTIWPLRVSRDRTFTSSHIHRYQIHVTRSGLDLYDRGYTVSGFQALAEIPGEVALSALQSALGHDDPDVQDIAIHELVRRGVRPDRIAAGLLRKFGVKTPEDFLLPVLAGEEPECTVAAFARLAFEKTKLRSNVLKLYLTWAGKKLGLKWEATWQTQNILQRLYSLAVHNPDETVRNEAVEALGKLDSNDVRRLLAAALSDKSLAVQLAAGEALIKIKASELYGRVSEAMHRVAITEPTLDFRNRIARTVKEIPGGLEPFYQPIREGFEHGRNIEQVLELIEDTIEIIPEDVYLFWLQGHAQKLSGRVEQAVDSFQRAFELENNAVVIPREIARTCLQLGNFGQAMEAARHGAEIGTEDAEGHWLLAKCCYKGRAFPEALEAAKKAVKRDPVHGKAIWILVLLYIHDGDIEASHEAFQHAQRVARLLSPGLSTSFVQIFIEEIENIKIQDPEMSQLVRDILDVVRAEDAARKN